MAKADELLNSFLREIAEEETEVVKDPDTGEDRMATKAEALVRLMWKMALGYKEETFVGDIRKTIVYPPNKTMINRIYERIEGKVPNTLEKDPRKKRLSVSERMAEETKKRLNSIVTSENAYEDSRKTGVRNSISP